MNILLLSLIGLSLSMDTFSISLCLGSFNITKKRGIFFCALVAVFHFIMPILGNLLGISITKFIVINPNKLLFLIFLFISIEMIIELFSKEEKDNSFSVLSLFLYAFSVSLDSLTVGIGLSSITTMPIFACFIFCLTSFVFTFLGLYIGRFSYERLGKIAKLIGLMIILFLTIIHFFK